MVEGQDTPPRGRGKTRTHYLSPFPPGLPDTIFRLMPQRPPAYQRLFAELKRRRVFRVMAVYGAMAFGVIEAADLIFPRLGLPDFTVTLIVWLAFLAFPVVAALTWTFDLTPEGVRRTEAAPPWELQQIITAPALKRWSSGVFALVGMTALLAGAWFAGGGCGRSWRI